jgi:hypothetical protein
LIDHDTTPPADDMTCGTPPEQFDDGLSDGPPLMLSAPQPVGYVIQDEASRFWSGEGWVTDWRDAEHFTCPDCCEKTAEAVEAATGRPCFARFLQVAGVSVPA